MTTTTTTTSPLLYVLSNGTLVPYTPISSADSVIHPSCIDDPFYAYATLAVVDMIAYCVPCITRSTYPAFRAGLFALNVALFANISFDLAYSPAYGVSWAFIGIVALSGLFFYWLARAWALFITLVAMLAVAFVNAQDFAERWMAKLLGTDVGSGWTNFLLFVFGVVVFALSYKAKDLRVIEWFLDSVVYSVLLIFALQYINFESQDHSTDAWVGTGFVPSPSQLCCDDVHVDCPIWFDWVSIFNMLSAAVVRITLVAFYEDVVVGTAPKAKHVEGAPLLGTETR
jgi:hypothetical protein